MHGYHFFSEPIQSNTKNYVGYQVFLFIFLINVEFLYLSVVTWSSLFCVLNTIY